MTAAERQMFEEINRRLKSIEEALLYFTDPSRRLSVEEKADIMVEALKSGDPVKIKAAKRVAAGGPAVRCAMKR